MKVTVINKEIIGITTNPVQQLSLNAIRVIGDQLYRVHYIVLYRYLYSRLRNARDAEDLAQTVFMKAYISLKKGIWDGGGAVYYLFTIARNTLIDYFRRKKHFPVYSDELVEDAADCMTTSGPIEEREQGELMLSCVSRLHKTEAEVLKLRFFSDMEYSAIAELLQKKEGTIRQIVHRGLKSLKKTLELEHQFEY